MNRRRSRYTVTFPDGTKKVVLAYNAQNIRNHYLFTNVRIEKGDYRTKARVAKTKAQGGFRVDQKALNEAKQILGLALPVNVRLHGRVGSVNGNYRLSGGCRHNIMLKSYLTPEQATETLWHELTHAKQAESALAEGKTWTAVSSNQRKSYPYSRRPIEIEARKTSKLMAPTHPLCV